jgi:hypothetical protein
LLVDRPYFYATGMERICHACTKDEWGIGGSQPSTLPLPGRSRSKQPDRTSLQNGIPGSNPYTGPNSDDQVRAHHEQAPARGEKRVLFRTVEGSSSYATDEFQNAMWTALTAAGVGGALYAVRMAKMASTARRLRAERGTPEPTAKQFDW